MNMCIFPVFKQILDKSISGSRGVPSGRSWRFWACLSGLVLATCILAIDPLFFNERDGFQYGCGIVCIMLSYIALSALFWDVLLFGKPRGANLILHWSSLVPFTLFTARVFAKPPASTRKTLMSVAWDAAKTIERNYIGISNKIQECLPWVTDVFSHWSIALMLVFVVLALCFKKKECKVGLLFSAFLFGFCGALALQASWQFIVGTLILVIAFSLMYNPYDEQCFYYNMVNELSREAIGETELDVVTKVMGEAYKRGRISENEFRDLVQSRLARSEFRSANDAPSAVVVHFLQLLRVHDFIRLAGDSSGTYLTVNPRLLSYNSLMNALTVYPRNVIVAMIGIIWVISPLDIIPDALPFVGVLDDTAIALLTMKNILTSQRKNGGATGSV